MSRQSWRVAILWMALSGYMNACLRALARHDGVEIFTSERRARSQAPFADEQFAWLRQRYIFARLPDFSELSPRLQSFEPDVLVICGWQIPAYRRVARLYRGRVPRVLCMDNQWRGSLRQRLGVWARHWYIQPLFDLAWVAGSSSASFARKLGFDASRILHGLNTCDHADLCCGALAAVDGPGAGPQLPLRRPPVAREGNRGAGGGIPKISRALARSLAADRLRHRPGSALAARPGRRRAAGLRPAGRAARPACGGGLLRGPEPGRDLVDLDPRGHGRGRARHLHDRLRSLGASGAGRPERYGDRAWRAGAARRGHGPIRTARAGAAPNHGRDRRQAVVAVHPGALGRNAALDQAAPGRGQAQAGRGTRA